MRYIAVVLKKSDISGCAAVGLWHSTLWLIIFLSLHITVCFIPDVNVLQCNEWSVMRKTLTHYIPAWCNISLLTSSWDSNYLSSQIHRHHLGLKWPDGDAFLNSRPVVVRVSRFPFDPDASPDSRKNLFSALSGLAGCRFGSFRDVQLDAWSATQHSSSSSSSTVWPALQWGRISAVEFFTEPRLECNT